MSREVICGVLASAALFASVLLGWSHLTAASMFAGGCVIGLSIATVIYRPRPPVPGSSDRTEEVEGQC